MGSYVLADTKSGGKTLIYRDDSEIRLHSAYDPEKEARRAVEGFKLGRASLITVCGLGLGYHVEELIARHPGERILVIERDAEVARIVGELKPELLQKVHLLAGGADPSPFFESLDMSDFRGMRRYVHQPSYGIDRKFYDNAVNGVGQYITSKISDLLTRFEFESLWTANIFANIPLAARAYPVAALFGAFRGYPGVIISAGPSLRKNMDLLLGLRDRALLVCVDTAAKVLDRRGIEPHLFMTLDAQKHSLRHFLGLSNQKPALVADLVSSPKVTSNYRGPLIVSSTSKYYTGADGALKRETTPTMDWIEQHIPSMGDIQSGGSVATSAFDLLLNLGCDPIILVGQDLAYTGREIHCSGTHHNDDWFPATNRTWNIDTINQKIIRKRKTKMIPSYGGKGEVISDFVFDLYRSWFEDSAGKVPVTVINATEGGGMIKNTAEESLVSLAKRLKPKDKTPSRVLSETFHHSPGIDLAPLKTAMESAVARLESLLERTGAAGADDIEAIDGIAESIETSDLRMLFSPILRKANLYLARKRLEPDKGLPFLLKEIHSAATVLKAILMKSAGRIGRL